MSLPKETRIAIRIIQRYLKFSPLGDIQIPIKDFIKGGIRADTVDLVLRQLFDYEVIENSYDLKNKIGYKTFNVDEKALLKLTKENSSKKKRIRFDKENNRLNVGKTYINLARSESKLDFCVAFFHSGKRYWEDIYKKIETTEEISDTKQAKRKIYDIYNKINLDAKKKKLQKIFKWTNGTIQLND